MDPILIEELPPCTGKHDIFFPPVGGKPEISNLNKERIQEAKSICQGCRFKKECLIRAVRNKEDHGVWGGVYFGSSRLKYKALRHMVRIYPELREHINFRNPV